MNVRAGNIAIKPSDENELVLITAVLVPVQSDQILTSMLFCAILCVLKPDTGINKPGVHLFGSTLNY